MKKVLEEVLATGCFLAFAAYGALSPEIVIPKRMPPAASEMPLSLPLQCDAWILQSGQGIKEPRARCYFNPRNKGR